MHTNSPTHAKRDTGWKRDGKVRGVYWRRRANGSKSWGYYADGKLNAAATRQDAIDQKAKARLRMSSGLPAPDTRVFIRDLAEEVREAKRRKLRASSFAAFEFALDRIVLPELGHLKPGQAAPIESPAWCGTLRRRDSRPHPFVAISVRSHPCSSSPFGAGSSRRARLRC